MTDSKILSVCMFCGSSTGGSQEIIDGVKLLSKTLAEAGMNLVYGGSAVGLMGIIAQEFLSADRRVTGIIPRALHEKVPALPIHETIVVETMHERKAEMYNRAQAFIALPGGIGTLEEILEVFTWSQLGFHTKPVCIYSVADFYNPLIELFQHLIKSGFMKQEHLDSLIVANTPETLLQKIQTYNYA